MFFRRNRIRIVLGNPLQDLNARDIELIPAGCTLVGADLSLDDHARLLGESFDRVEDFRRDSILRHHALNQPGAIANGGRAVSRYPQVVEPAPDGDGLAFCLPISEIVLTGDDIRFHETFYRRARGERRENEAILNSLSLLLSLRSRRPRRLNDLGRFQFYERLFHFLRQITFSSASTSSRKGGVCGAERSNSIASFQSMVPAPGHRWESRSPALSCTCVE